MNIQTRGVVVGLSYILRYNVNVKDINKSYILRYNDS